MDLLAAELVSRAWKSAWHAVGMGLQVVKSSQTQPGYKFLESVHKRHIGAGVPQKEAEVIMAEESHEVLDLGPSWLKWPDYAKVNNINLLVAHVWPQVTTAISHQVRTQMVDVINQYVKEYAAGYISQVTIDALDLGDIPMKLGGLKTYHSEDDEIMLESEVVWGSRLHCQVTVHVQMWGNEKWLSVPLVVNNVQFKGKCRITARPLMTRYPYAGSVSVSFLSLPHVDWEMPVLGDLGVDLMALPGVKSGLSYALRYVMRHFLLYPKSYLVELIPNGANPPGPVGMMVVKLVKAQGLRSSDLLSLSDPYCLIQIREGRTSRSRTVSNNNNPVFNEDFAIVVDNPEKQRFSLVVKDDDFGIADEILGVADIPLVGSPFLVAPNTRIPFTLTLRKPKEGAAAGIDGWGLMAKLGSVPRDAMQRVGHALGKGEGEQEKEEDGATDFWSDQSDPDSSLEGVHGEPGTTSLTRLRSRSAPGSPVRAPRDPSAPPGTPGRYPKGQAPRAPEPAVPSGQGYATSTRGQAHLEPNQEGPKPIPTEGGSSNGQGPSSHPLGKEEGPSQGVVFLEAIFVPFRNRESATSQRREDVEGTIDPSSVGVFTVTLVKCGHLSGWSGEPDPYVNLKVVDEERGTTEDQSSSVVFNETSPRWGEKFDFVGVSAGSRLLVSVMDKTTAWQGVLSTKIKGRFEDRLMGRLTISVMDVVPSGRVRQTWPLQQAEEGDITLVLEWLPVNIDQPELLDGIRAKASRG